MNKELKVLQELREYFEMQLDAVPISDWGIGAKDGFKHAKDMLDHLCELHEVQL